MLDAAWGKKRENNYTSTLSADIRIIKSRIHQITDTPIKSLQSLSLIVIRQ